MQWVSKAVQYYKDINPATLTGAIDVIVVERPTGTGAEGDVELACSPFHVRFGKLSVLRPVDKKVRITVNDERIPFYMKVGETGEAFFVFETDEDVPADMQTSPLSGPVSDDGRSDAGEEGMEPLDLDAPAMDDEREQEADEDQPLTPTPSHPSSPNSSRYASLAGTQVNSPASTFRSFPSTPFMHNASSPSPSRNGSVDLGVTDVPLVDSPSDEQGPSSRSEGRQTTKDKTGAHMPSPLAHAAEHVAGAGANAARHIGHDLRDAELRHQMRDEYDRRRRSNRDEHDLKGEPAELGQVDKGVRADLEGLSLEDRADGEQTPPLSTGDEVIAAARDRNKDVRELLGGKGGVGHAQSFDGSVAPEVDFSMRPFPTGVHHEAAAPEQSGALMLDMSGYKVGGEKEGNEKGKAAAEEEERVVDSTDLVLGLDDKAEKEIISFTQALLQSTDPATLRQFFDDPRMPDDAETPPRASSPIPPLDLDAPASSDFAPERKIRPRSRVSSRASSPPPRALSISSLQSIHAEADSAPGPDDGVYHASPRQFTLKTGGTTYVFELSLCGSEDFQQVDKETADRLFVDHQLTFAQFMEDDSISDNPDLVVKYAGRYLTWDNASPILASLAVYRKSLVDHPEHHRHIAGQAVSGDGAASAQGKATHRRGWSLWWGRNRAAQAADDAASVSSAPTADVSAPTSPPTSPPDSPRSLPADVVELLSPPPEMQEDDFPEEDHSKHYAKTLRLTSDQLKELKLKKGMNTISFSVRSSYSGYATCTSRVFLWESDFQVVISDIDGTITKSDALGHVFTMIGRDWTHLGVAKLYTDIARNGYKMMYLTSRAIGQADTTREYLKGIKQNEFVLPEGPVIMSPDRLMTSLHREVIMRKPEVFKMACLRDIARLFGERSPFYAGFGNRITDALSYRSVDIPSSRIFTIDSNGEVKMELLELAGYKSSYIHMTDLVDQMFPPINRKTAPDFTDFNYWRTPLPTIDLPELQPPSPALSARSDQSTSRLSLTRLGSLASTLSRRSSRQTLADGGAAANRNQRGATPTSPLLQATVPEEGLDEDEDDDESFLGGRSRSSSMPGSLPDESDFERYRAMARGATSEAEAYKKKVTGVDEHDEDEEEYPEEDEAPEEEGEGDDFGDQLDFSSVPYL
ncbi:hypothetical protein JCM8097_009453 [Rhodosporidiobolus ruineniae]